MKLKKYITIFLLAGFMTPSTLPVDLPGVSEEVQTQKTIWEKAKGFFSKTGEKIAKKGKEAKEKIGENIPKPVKKEWKLITPHLPTQIRAQLIMAMAGTAVFLMWEWPWDKIKKWIFGSDHDDDEPRGSYYEKIKPTKTKEKDIAGGIVPRQIKNLLKRIKHNVAGHKTILLYGPTGTGKSLLAEVILKELGVKYIYVTSGPDLRDKYEGGSSDKLNKIFREAKKSTSSLYAKTINLAGKPFGKVLITGNKVGIILEEIDGGFKGMNSDTNNGQGAAIAEKLQAIMDQYRDYEIYIIATTNYEDTNNIPAPVLRRFDIHEKVDTPNTKQREALAEHYINKHKLKIRKNNGIDLHKKATEKQQKTEIKKKQGLLTKIKETLQNTKTKLKDHLRKRHTKEQEEEDTKEKERIIKDIAQKTEGFNSAGMRKLIEESKVNSQLDKRTHVTEKDIEKALKTAKGNNILLRKEEQRKTRTGGGRLLYRY